VPASDHIRHLRSRVGHALLLLPSVTALLFDEDGRVLLARHAESGYWVAPGGCVDPMETPADAAVRETWEETGLLTRPVRILGVFGGPDFVVRYANGDEVAYVMTVFECERRAGTARPDGEELVELGWFAAADLPESLAPWARLVVPLAMANRHVASFTAATWRPSPA
jgi:8-oxo-dGTP pyrophosphatase MutT (NUDIX family)